MSPDVLPRRRFPCAECPFRRDTKPGQFPACRYEALRATAGKAGAEVPMNAPLFACHKSTEGRDEVCAGWLAVCGAEHLGVRVAVLTGRIEPEHLRPAEGWPALYDSYDEMAAAMAGQE